VFPNNKGATKHVKGLVMVLKGGPGQAQAVGANSHGLEKSKATGAKAMANSGGHRDGVARQGRIEYPRTKFIEGINESYSIVQKVEFGQIISKIEFGQIAVAAINAVF
jgi:hypothetical protein